VDLRGLQMILHDLQGICDILRFYRAAVEIAPIMVIVKEVSMKMRNFNFNAENP
jgi:hypothetical protein